MSAAADRLEYQQAAYEEKVKDAIVYDLNMLREHRQFQDICDQIIARLEDEGGVFARLYAQNRFDECELGKRVKLSINETIDDVIEDNRDAINEITRDWK